jgi:hypothetical protein
MSVPAYRFDESNSEAVAAAVVAAAALTTGLLSATRLAAGRAEQAAES